MPTSQIQHQDEPKKLQVRRNIVLTIEHCQQCGKVLPAGQRVRVTIYPEEPEACREVPFTGAACSSCVPTIENAVKSKLPEVPVRVELYSLRKLELV